MIYISFKNLKERRIFHPNVKLCLFARQFVEQTDFEKKDTLIYPSVLG